MATIGRNAAVNEYPIGLRVRGLPAWLAWLFLRLLCLAGFRNRLSALLTWSWSYLTSDRSLRAVFDSAPADTKQPGPSRPSALQGTPKEPPAA